MHLKKVNATLKDENATLRLGTVAVVSATTAREVSQQSELLTEAKASGAVADKKSAPYLGTINPSVCTTFSVAMTETEEEPEACLASHLWKETEAEPGPEACDLVQSSWLAPSLVSQSPRQAAQKNCGGIPD